MRDTFLQVFVCRFARDFYSSPTFFVKVCFVKFGNGFYAAITFSSSCIAFRSIWALVAEKLRSDKKIITEGEKG